MGIILSRAIRALLGAIVWSAVAVAMYAILRALGNVTTPFDALRELASLIASLVNAAGAIIGGAGFKGLWLLMPALPGQEDAVLLLAAVVRLVEFIALAMVVVALLRVIAVINHGRKFSHP